MAQNDNDNTDHHSQISSPLSSVMYVQPGLVWYLKRGGRRTMRIMIHGSSVSMFGPPHKLRPSNHSDILRPPWRHPPGQRLKQLSTVCTCLNVEESGHFEGGQLSALSVTSLHTNNYNSLIGLYRYISLVI